VQAKCGSMPVIVNLKFIQRCVRVASHPSRMRRFDVRQKVLGASMKQAMGVLLRCQSGFKQKVSPKVPYSCEDLHSISATTTSQSPAIVSENDGTNTYIDIIERL
jgi:hypothetical protein